MSLDDLKQKIKEEIPISQIVSNYVSTKRSGTSLVALCPFHSDTKPSMHINDSKKIYKCFACGAAGDAITFVMKSQNLDYVSALKDICQKTGLHFESYQEEKKQNPKIEMAKKILNKASLLYRKLGTTKSFTPYNEFIVKRGLDEDIAQTYSLGYAHGKNPLLEYLHTIKDTNERKLAIDTAIEIGIIKENPNNKDNHYDTFRDRIMFPIWDQFGHVIGFTSRATRDEQVPKYMNSKDSQVFNKSNLLYGLHLAKNAIREKDFVLIVEGNMDQIALTHNGFNNSVAIMGVALGAQSLERLLGITKNFYLALDSDQAGFMAMKRINQQLAEKGIVAKYIEFLPEKDPDEFLKTHGKIKFQEKIDNAIPAFDLLLDQLIPEKLPEIVDKKLQILNEAFALLSPLQSHLNATERLISFSKRLGLKADASQIIESYSKFLKTNAIHKANPVPKSPESSPSINLFSEEVENENEFDQKKLIQPNLTKNEKLLLQELVQLPSLITHGNIHELLDLVESTEVKKYIGKIKQLYLEIDENEYGSVVVSIADSGEFSDELKETVCSAVFKFRPKELDSNTKDRIIFDLKVKIESEKLIKEKEKLKSLQVDVSTQEELNKILNEIVKIDKKLQEIKKVKPVKKYKGE